MAVQILRNHSVTTANTVEIAYTAEEDVEILQFVVSNNSGVNHSYKAYIFNLSGDSTEAIQPIKFITSLRGSHISWPMIGQVIPKGGSLRVEASSSALIFNVTGQ